jgi:ABC-type molybdate transport system substrate-binding protein
VFITYCTNAEVVRREEPTLQVLAIPETINVAADYGLAVMRAANPAAQRFAQYLLSPPAQERLRALGFAAP